ncbi:aminotransferase class V-fold PLP-dependent enzyme [Candidatus Uhrbacteria bacterium]|nr:MAG: aminotransferase class V-fold PLP-dependent enzyme [Candidatus Uhrbacteria bacterium]
MRKRTNIIYLDHAATTPTDKAVLKAMQPYFSDVFGNPSSFHTLGMRAKEAVTEARIKIAKLLNAHEDEILFTSGGTESDNMAVLGVPRYFVAEIKKTHGPEAVPHVITSAIEHHAVLEPLIWQQRRKEIELTVVGVDRYGMVDPKEIAAAIKPTTVLISIMMANNEIGTIEPIAEIGRALLKHRKEKGTALPYFHTDACQATGFLEIDVEKLHVDLLTLNGSKIYGPKGVGALYVRRGVKFQPLMIGGGQEKNLRSGTENVPAIVGLAKALELAQSDRERESARLTELRDRLAAGLLAIPKTILNGHPTERLPNSVNVSFIDIEGEAAVLYLDAEGVMASTGSACASTSLDPSHVILATGLSYEAAHGSIRFTLGHATTKKDVDHVLKIVPGIVERLRMMSPVNLDMKYFDRLTNSD